MKFNCKHTHYTAPGGEVYKNPWVETGEAKIDSKNKRFEVPFHLWALNGNGVPRILDTHSVILLENGRDTIIEDNGETFEIIEFITNGGVYDQQKINDWGLPSYFGAQAYFKPESLWTGLEFQDQDLKFLAIDWVLNVVSIHGKPLKENFVLETS